MILLEWVDFSRVTNRFLGMERGRKLEIEEACPFLDKKSACGAISLEIDSPGICLSPNGSSCKSQLDKGQRVVS